MKTLSIRTTVLSVGAVLLSVSACTSVPPLPLDAQQTAAALAARDLNDPSVHAALDKAHIAVTGDKPWSLDALTVAAWVLRPEVKSAAADVQAAAAAIRTANEIPNPTLTLDPSYLYDNATGNMSPWSLAAALGFTIELGGKRGIRTAQAQFNRESLSWQYAETLWRVRQEVRKALIAQQLAERALQLSEREVELRKIFSTWVENQFNYGAVAQPDRLVAATNLAQAQAMLRTARGDLVTAHSALAAAIGITSAKLPQGEIAVLPVEALSRLDLTDAGLRDAAVINRLSLRRALADYNSTEQALRLTVAKQYPDVAFGPGYIYDKGDRGVTLNLGFTLPLFHGSRNPIDEALAARAKSAAAFEVEQASALSALESSLAGSTAAIAALAEAKAAENASVSASEAAHRSLDKGLADRGDVVAAQLSYLVAERGTLDALRAVLSATGSIEDATQRPYWPQSALDGYLSTFSKTKDAGAQHP